MEMPKTSANSESVSAADKVVSYEKSWYNDFNQMTQAQQKQFIKNLGHIQISNRTLTAIRQGLKKNDLTILHSLVDEYGLNTVVSTFVSTIYEETINAVSEWGK